MIPGAGVCAVRDGRIGAPARLAGFQRDVLIGPGICEGRDQTEPRLRDPRPIAVDEAQLPDRRIYRAFMHQLLDLVEDRLAALVVQLLRLLQEQGVDVWVITVGE